ncbi:MAG: cysteine desulfurase [Cyclobacteriaceae bacterium]|nr:cysteine desulfurase [Cyclobacteriaceae bacterium HetDA_MAG_MS6]
MKVYFDNAATTPLDPAVFEAMKPLMLDLYGNPSSIHSHGREVRSSIERSRKKVADLLNTSPSEIFFTSGGTEADNTALCSTIDSYGIKNVISSKVEHHAVLHTLENLEKTGRIKLHFVALNDNGEVEMDHLEQLLIQHPKCLVSLMHANNEIANIIDLNALGELCEAHEAKLHSDTVQTMGHFTHDLQQIKAHCIVGSAHKFHGPKGIGFLYVRHDHKINPFIYGGAQERNMRGGTENVYGIVGLAKALELAYEGMSEHARHIKSLKGIMIKRLKESIPDVHFNGLSDDIENSLYTVLNVCLPPSGDNDMLLFNLDISGISVSGGSACSSGSNIGSHVLAELKRDSSRGAVRFSFSKYNTEEEVEYAVRKLAELTTASVS